MHLYSYSLATKKFYADNGFLHASALTFYTLFAVVPILATAFGIAKGFGLEMFLHAQLEKAFPGQETVVQFLSQYAENLLAQSSGGLIAGVAILLLFYSIYNMLNHIEKSMNQVWQVSSQRKISLRISYYLSLVLVAPIILVVTGSLQLFIAKQINQYNFLLSLVRGVTSMSLIVLLFSWLYQFMPNIKVKTKPALIAGLHTGLAYLVIQWLLIESQLIMLNYSAVYGSLAALPIFLIWVQISWVLVIYGAQLCFALQNEVQKIWQLDIDSLAPDSRNALLLRLAHACIHNFSLDQQRFTLDDLAIELQLPVCCVRQLIAKLIQANIVIEVITTNSQVHSYQPAKDITLLSDSYILQAINQIGAVYE